MCLWYKTECRLWSLTSASWGPVSRFCWTFFQFTVEVKRLHWSGTWRVANTWSRLLWFVDSWHSVSEESNVQICMFWKFDASFCLTNRRNSKFPTLVSFISCLSIRSLFVLNKGSQRKNPLICSDHSHHRSEGRIQEDILTDCGQHQWWSTLQRIDCKNWWRLHLAINGPCPRLDKRPCTKFQKMKISLNNGVAVQKNPWLLLR